MRFARSLIVLGGFTLAAACQPADHAPAVPAAPTAPPSRPESPAAAAAAPDMAPNADAARYGPHGVAATPPPAPTTAPKAAPAPGAPAVGEAPLPAGDEAVADMRGHPCECGKSCHCGHCSGAVPGCHCHIKRADGKGAD